METLWIFEYDALDMGLYSFADEACERIRADGDHIAIVGNADRQLFAFEQLISMRSMAIGAESFLVAPEPNSEKVQKVFESPNPEGVFHPDDIHPLPSPNMLNALIRQSPPVGYVIFVVHDINNLIAATMAGIHGEMARSFYMTFEKTR